MLTWRMAQVAAICTMISLCVLPAGAGNNDLPEPDYEAVRERARRIDRDTPYVMSLPKRKRECLEIADRYFDAGTTAEMAEGAFIMKECYSAMILRMAELYYQSDAFGPGGMPTLLDDLRKNLSRLYHGIYQGQFKCGNNCGSMGYLLGVSDAMGEIERAVRVMAAQQMFDDKFAGWMSEWGMADWGQ